MTAADTRVQWQAELVARRQAVWAIGQAHGCDGVVVFGSAGHGEPFRYLTDFMPVIGDAFGWLRDADQMVCAQSFHWQIPEAQRRSGIDVWQGRFDAPTLAAELIRADRPRRVGVVGLNRLPTTAYRTLNEMVGAKEWIDLDGAAATLRRVKSDLEIERLRIAGRITDAALDDLRAGIRPGMTEHELAARAAFVIQTHGAALSFEPTVMTGNDDPTIIRMPTDRRVAEGDTVMIDLGASYQGYQADAARTLVIGEPNPTQIQVWDVVTRAYAAALERVRPGCVARTLHEAAVEVIEQAGYRLAHRIGHGIGLATSFEWPSLDTEVAPLEAGMTFCLEPGIYVPGAGSMKYEDDVLVTDSGYELLTSCPAGLATAT